MMRDGSAAWAATGAVSHRPYHLTLLAEAIGHDGRRDEALAVLEEALVLVETTQERFLKAETHRVSAELLATGAAISGYRRAAAIARRPQAKGLAGFTRLRPGRDDPSRRGWRAGGEVVTSPARPGPGLARSRWYDSARRGVRRFGPPLRPPTG
jgi:hypothetical protein